MKHLYITPILLLLLLSYVAHAQPVITTQPQSVSVCESVQILVFTVAATGTNLSYQWQISGDGIQWSNSTDMGAKSATVTFLNNPAWDGFHVRVIVDGDGGSITSDEVTVTVFRNPVITAQPKDLEAFIGSTANFTMEAQGSNLQYQWSSSVDGVYWSEIAGATNKILAIPHITASDNNKQYQVNVSSGSCAPSVFSNPAILTVSSSGSIIYVNDSIDVQGDGSMWSKAMKELSDALKEAEEINASTPGTIKQIWVAGGTYQPKYRADNMSNADANDRDNAFVLLKDVKIYGGFAGTETTLEERNLSLKDNASILSGDLGIPNNNYDNAYHVIVSAGDAGAAELNGFTIKDASASGGGNIQVNSMSIDQYSGGGIYNDGSSPTLTNVIISLNRSNIYGGGIYNKSSSSPVLTNVTISSNSSNEGGGIYNESNSSPVLTNVVINGNTAIAGGGIANNASPVLTNVTIFGNTASFAGGGIYNYTSTNPKIRNSIIYGNSSGIEEAESDVSPVIEYSLVQDLTSTDNGNIADPIPSPFLLFEDAAHGDYHLTTGSLAINAGNNVYFGAGQTPDLHLITTDLDGNFRIQKGIVDLGAYEYMETLPIALENFTALKDGEYAKLEWTTASEINNKEFIISRSKDGSTFTEIGKVAGAGSTSIQKEYTFFDKKPANGTNYYRMQQVDMDGRINEIGIRTVRFSSANSSIKIYPNPTENDVRIEFSAGLYRQLEISDNTGKVLQKITLGINDREKILHLGNYPAGVYLIRFIGEHAVTEEVIKK